ncbi:VPA1262 family N-terminal domain-containing protein [Hymenobacter aerophilus]|uniref:VPA1262 family N-terminal domain-containing protein n=1 Tax=Hymenobacter aerophilus TaxID=119644 RepID=UPI00039AA8D5|nr:VPA1262 family N-terminal domain-containing protein [Hymenobacter aerophilus]
MPKPLVASPLQQDYATLTATGNIAFYESCEVTQLFLCDKEKRVYNLFTLASFEEKPFVATDKQFLTEGMLRVTNTLSIGIQRYWLTLPEALITFDTLLHTNKWDCQGNTSLILPTLTPLPKQFIPASDSSSVRANAVLKNNFDNGAYLLEFFDESKEYVDSLFAVENVDTLNKLAAQVKAILPIDLAVARDRLGNILFEFPIHLLASTSQALKQWNGVNVQLGWHSKLTSLPDCLLQVEAKLDHVYTGSTIDVYGGQASQPVIIGNITGLTNIKIWRKNPLLLLSVFDGTYVRDIGFDIGIINHEPRTFLSQGQKYEVQVQSAERERSLQSRTYNQHVQNALYTAEREALAQQLAFKQYFVGSRTEALTDLRTLLNRHGKRGAYLWDPFLTAADILATLFFCRYDGVPLRAIGSDNKATKTVNSNKGKSPAAVIQGEAAVFASNVLSKVNLLLEFRLQHGSYGYAFHDRFLIFPAGNDERPLAYSLGTSVNSAGTSHHILQEVSHPQRIVDAFTQLWDALADPACLVWKA